MGMSLSDESKRDETAQAVKGTSEKEHKQFFSPRKFDLPSDQIRSKM